MQQKATRRRGGGAADSEAAQTRDALPLSLITRLKSGFQPEVRSEEELGLEPGLDPGLEPGLEPGLDLGFEPGFDSGFEPGLALDLELRADGLDLPPDLPSDLPPDLLPDFLPNLPPDLDAPVDAGRSRFAQTIREQDAGSRKSVETPAASPMLEEDIAAHLSMVRFLARRIHERLPSHVELEELVGAGVLGLMDAYKKFNPEKKVKFRSYAQFRVRGAILDSLRTLDWSPRELRRKAREIEAAIQRLTGRVGRSPNELEVAVELKMSLPDYQHLLGDLKSLELGTLNAERSEDSGEEELAYVPNRSEDDPLFQCLRSEMHGRLRDAIERLPDRERMVLNLYYFEELTMKEIGQILGVVESRISQVHASAVLHMRAAMQAPVSAAHRADHAHPSDRQKKRLL